MKFEATKGMKYDVDNDNEKNMGEEEEEVDDVKKRAN